MLPLPRLGQNRRQYPKEPAGQGLGPRCPCAYTHRHFYLTFGILCHVYIFTYVCDGIYLHVWEVVPSGLASSMKPLFPPRVFYWSHISYGRPVLGTNLTGVPRDSRHKRQTDMGTNLTGMPRDSRNKRQTDRHTGGLGEIPAFWMLCGLIMESQTVIAYS